MTKYTPSPEELQKWLKNLLLFTAPVLAVLFYQLSDGVEIKKALPIAMYALYALLADYFKKLNNK